MTDENQGRTDEPAETPAADTQPTSSAGTDEAAAPEDTAPAEPTAADALRGKRKPAYTPHVDVGDFVVVVNAEKIAVTGQKLHEKIYYRHSGYPGGLKKRTLNDMLERRPEEVIRLAVRGMLPKNRLARKQLTKLKVYAGPDHPHAAQQPQALDLPKARRSEA